VEAGVAAAPGLVAGAVAVVMPIAAALEDVVRRPGAAVGGGPPLPVARAPGAGARVGGSDVASCGSAALSGRQWHHPAKGSQGEAGVVEGAEVALVGGVEIVDVLQGYSHGLAGLLLLR
jgi:hypothetical protein